MAEQFQNAAAQGQFLDSLDTKGMGGMLSPALQNTAPVEDTDTRPEELELMYDPQLNCFYDPFTCKYYELVQNAS